MGREALDLVVHPEDALGTGHGANIGGRTGGRSGDQRRRQDCEASGEHELAGRRSSTVPTAPTVLRPFRNLPSPRTLPAVTYNSFLSPDILVVRFSSIGDILLTTPLLRAIRTKWPGARVTVLTKRQYVSLVSDNPNVTEVFGIGPQQRIRSVAAQIKSREVLAHARPAGRAPDGRAAACWRPGRGRLSASPGGAGAAHPLQAQHVPGARPGRGAVLRGRGRPRASSPTAARRSSS